MKRLLIALLLVATGAFAQSDPALDARLKKLEEELRCLVCQNQSLADSSAPLAEDLRREVRALAASGKNDDEIKEFLVARYGDFVLYDPPVKRITWLLWFGPFVLLAAGAAIWWMIARRRRPEGSDDEPPPPSGVGLPEGADQPVSRGGPRDGVGRAGAGAVLDHGAAVQRAPDLEGRRAGRPADVDDRGKDDRARARNHPDD